MSDDQLALALDRLLARFAAPLTEADKKGGWTDANRDAWGWYFAGARDALYPEEGPRSLLRLLDAQGIVDGPLLDEVADVRALLRERWADIANPS